MKKHSAALIGCGRIGCLLENDPLRNKPCTHAGGVCAAGIQITHAADADISRLDAFCTKNAIPSYRASTDYRDLFTRDAPEIVIVATWTNSHAEITRYAAEHGARIIVTEKPIAANMSDAYKMIECCKKNDVCLIINHERRYDPRYRAVRHLLEKGAIGTVKTVNAAVFTGAYRGASLIADGGGPLLHDGTHLVDIIRFFFGDIDSVRGNFSRDTRTAGFEDRAVAWLKMQNGIDVFLEAGGSRSYFGFELNISGTKGKIGIGNGFNHLYKTVPSKLYAGFRDLEEVQFPAMQKTNCFTELYREVKKAALKQSGEITSSGYDGLKALEAVHSIYLSSHLSKPVSLPVQISSIHLDKIFSL